MQSFVCNICGGTQRIASLFDIDREWTSCFKCGSSARTRWIVYALSSAVFGKSLALPSFPLRKDIQGIGLSDSKALARGLANSFTYTNTFFDEEPRFDITAEVDQEHRDRYDFVVASEVFEHIAPPVQRAFDNLSLLLKPGGLVVFTVPWGPGQTAEYFPNLHRWRVVDESGRSVLLNETPAGDQERFEDLSFHGGPGSTLEMRRFGKLDVEGHFRAAGFRFVEFAPAHTDLGQGIVFYEDNSLPCIAHGHSGRLIHAQKARLKQSRREVRLLSGWYELRGDWRWTSAEFGFVLKREGCRRNKLVMRFVNPYPLSGQVLTIEAHGIHIASTEVTSGLQVLEATLPPQLQKFDLVRFSAEVNPPQAPAPNDDRKLGVLVRFNSLQWIRRRPPFYIE